MSDAIRAEGLSKRYRIGQLLKHRTFRDVLAGGLAAPYRWTATLFNGGPSRNGHKSEIWALKDVSFKIDAGEVVAIIGRNGAGKSTLLKMLSRIIEPTEGFAELYGRVGSLLEVGTGFHPQLTGRENIYLNGAILGMRRREIARKFDEIVAFAETEQFLDTAVKYYSSGMYMRLGFAVAAHLEPEILLVDEVLAVGDLAFQRKCLAKIKEVAREGRTVLFVSHQLNSVRTLCDRALWLEAGRLRQSGSMLEIVSAYEASFSSSATATRNGQSENSAAKFISWEIAHPRAEQPHVLETQGAVAVNVIVEVHKAIQHGVFGVALRNGESQILWGWATDGIELAPGIQALQIQLPGLPLKPGAYEWDVSLRSDGTFIDRWHCTPHMIIATAPLADPRDEWSGVLNIPCEFRVLEEARR